jgi:fatty acid desaturase
MLASMHAVQVTHLHHHRHCLDEHDHEAAHAGLPWWRVLLMGPGFAFALHRAAWRLASPAKRRWIALELAMIGALLAAAAAGALLWGGPAWLLWHLAAMVVGESFTGFFAVWIVHRGCHADGQIARTQRGWMKNVVSYSMFYHLEHHLFPAVPTCHLPTLADRIDVAAPEVKQLQVV